jgi:DNA-directed RNA polymerase subunit RPC12/RpoP
MADFVQACDSCGKALEEEPIFYIHSLYHTPDREYDQVAALCPDCGWRVLGQIKNSDSKIIEYDTCVGKMAEQTIDLPFDRDNKRCAIGDIVYDSSGGEFLVVGIHPDDPRVLIVRDLENFTYNSVGSFNVTHEFPDTMEQLEEDIVDKIGNCTWSQEYTRKHPDWCDEYTCAECRKYTARKFIERAQKIGDIK